MPFRKLANKAYRGAKKAVKKRYGLNKKSSGIKYGRIAQDVMMLKKMVNAEKKSYNFLYNLSAATAIGQVDGTTATGALCLDITPYIPQGVGADARTGASVKLCSALYQFQINQQSALTIDQKLVFEFWVVKGTSLLTTEIQPLIHANSTFSGVIDSNSPRNQDRYSDFQLLRKVTKVLKADPNSGDNNQITFNIPMKFNRGQGHHVRLNTSPTGVPSDCLNGQIIMTVRADVGNKNAVTASARQVPLTAINTGSIMRFAYKVWYYDN